MNRKSPDYNVVETGQNTVKSLEDQWRLAVLRLHLAQSTRTAEYTDCISTKGEDSYNECPGYNTKLFDGEATVMLELW